MGLTKRLYWKNTYQFMCKARVIAVGRDMAKGYWVRLDQTIFRAQGGGQPADQGLIGPYHVTDLVEKESEHAKSYDEAEITHYFGDINPKYNEGDEVDLVIDGLFRLQSAALHTAGHVMAGCMRHYHGYSEQVAANHFKGQSRVGFKKDGEAFTLETINEEGQKIVDEGRAVTERFGESHPLYHREGRDTHTRLVNITDLWEEPCSGTHVSSTDEIDAFAGTKLSTKKGKVSVSYSSEYDLSKLPADVRAALEENIKIIEKYAGSKDPKIPAKEGKLVTDETVPTNGELLNKVINPNGSAVYFHYETDETGKTGQIVATVKATDDDSARVLKTYHVDNLHINEGNHLGYTRAFSERTLRWQIAAVRRVKEVTTVFRSELLITKLSDWEFDERFVKKPKASAIAGAAAGAGAAASGAGAAAIRTAGAARAAAASGAGAGPSIDEEASAARA